MSNSDKFLDRNEGVSSLLKPAGSKAPMDANEGKWHKGVDAAGLEKLDKIATDVAEEVDKAVTQMVRAKLKIGKLLNQAREVFPGDKEFGQWRKQALPNISTTECSYCMRAAEKFGSAPELLEKMGWSAMRELTYAPPYMINRLKDGDMEVPASKSEARQAVSDARASEDATPPATDGARAGDPVHTHVPPDELTEEGRGDSREDASPPPADDSNKIRVGNKKYEPLTVSEKWMYFMSLSVERRVELGAAFGFDPFITLGLPPDSEMQLISPDAVRALLNGYLTDVGLSQEVVAALKSAAEEVIEMSNANLQTLVDGRVSERFKAEQSK